MGICCNASELDHQRNIHIDKSINERLNEAGLKTVVRGIHTTLDEEYTL